jgi:hypothetical protein
MRGVYVPMTNVDGTGDVTGNLYNAVCDELDRGEIIGLNNILKKKGITYQF